NSGRISSRGAAVVQPPVAACAGAAAPAWLRRLSARRDTPARPMASKKTTSWRCMTVPPTVGVIFSQGECARITHIARDDYTEGNWRQSHKARRFARSSRKCGAKQGPRPGTDSSDPARDYLADHLPVASKGPDGEFEERRRVVDEQVSHPGNQIREHRREDE